MGTNKLVIHDETQLGAKVTCFELQLSFAGAELFTSSAYTQSQRRSVWKLFTQNFAYE